MKKIIFLLILILNTKLGFVQELNNYTESAFVNIDRSIYISGESIRFASTVWSNKDLLSKILYVELINPTGKQIVGKKYQIKDSKCSGEVLIPENLQTGNYYIRVYTKFMRNYDPYTYGYQFIKIVNPYSSDIQNDFNEINKSDTVSLESYVTNQKGFKIQINDTVCFTRDNINIKVSKIFPEPIISVSFTVSPSNSVNFQNLISERQFIPVNKFIAETRGITLTGLLQNKQNSEPIPGKRVNLSILENDKNTFYSVYSDTEGRFYFTLPDMIGNRDLFLSAEEIQDVTPEMLVDNDFCTDDILLPNPKFRLSSEEKDIAYSMAINCKVQDQFLKNEQIARGDLGLIEIDTVPFYGKPTSIVNIDDYIAMPTLEDYFNEISFSAGIRKVNGKKQFKIFGDRPELALYDPLIMVDLVPINNIDDILKASPKDISRIEIVAAPYILGNIIYGGIMNIISRRNDIAGIKLPKTGIFLNYTFFKDEKDAKFKISDSRNIPDARNTLYWNSDLKFDNSNTANISFRTSDMKANYTIYVTGISKSGKVVSASLNFEVK